MRTPDCKINQGTVNFLELLQLLRPFVWRVSIFIFDKIFASESTGRYSHVYIMNSLTVSSCKVFASPTPLPPNLSSHSGPT